MPLNAPESLSWRLRSRPLSPRDMALLVGFILAAGVLLLWKKDLDAERAASEQRLAHALAMPLPTDRHPVAGPTLTAAGTRQLQEQMGLLNRDWPHLLAAVAPQSPPVKILGLDVNPATGSVRVTGQAATSAAANAYAASLDQHPTQLQRVRLLMLERRADGVRFEVSAQWPR